MPLGLCLAGKSFVSLFESSSLRPLLDELSPGPLGVGGKPILRCLHID